MSETDFKQVDRLASLLAKKTVGTLNAAEQQELDAWLAGNDRRREHAELLATASFLAEERRRLQAIDAQAAQRRMEQRIQTSAPTTVGQQPASRSRVPLFIYSRRLRVAAVALVLVAAGALVWWRQYSRVAPPELSDAVQLAMERSAQSGRDDADHGKVFWAKPGTEAQVQAWQQSKVGQQIELADDITADQVAAVGDDVKDLLMEATMVTTRADREYWQRLEDGTLVHLNYNTHIVYPEHFFGRNRDVFLEGEAYFMVAHDRRHPFIVHTQQGDVRVYGTEFNVNTRGERPAVRGERSAVRGQKNESGTETLTEVVLVKGSVSVTPKGGTEQSMKPGQKCSMFNVQCSMEKVDVEPYVAWNTGMFSFDDCPLEQLMEVLARWYGCHVSFRSEEARQRRFTGSVDRYASIGPTLDAISEVTGLTLEVKNGEITIK